MKCPMACSAVKNKAGKKADGMYDGLDKSVVMDNFDSPSITAPVLFSDPQQYNKRYWYYQNE